MEMTNADIFESQSQDFSHQSDEDESGFYENDDFSDEDYEGDDFIESGDSFFVTTDESFHKVEAFKETKNLEDSSENMPEFKETKALESESLLDKFENFFNNMKVDEDYIDKNEVKVDNIGEIKASGEEIKDSADDRIIYDTQDVLQINEEYYCYFLLCSFKIKTDPHVSENGAAYNHLLTNHGSQKSDQEFLSLEEKKACTSRQGLKWPIKYCKVALKNINSTNGNVKSNPSKNVEEKAELEESDIAHEKYLLDINQNESFASLWKMHLEIFKDGFKCNICIDSFQRKNDLKIHQKRQHPHSLTKTPLNSKISVADQKATKSSQTSIEKLNKIENEPLIQIPMEKSNETAKSCKDSSRKVVKCDFCDKEYERQAPLRKHTLLHNCELCNITFSGSKWKKDLTSHNKDQHRDNETTFSKFEDPLLGGKSEIAQSTPLPKRIRLSPRLSQNLNVSI